VAVFSFQYHRVVHFGTFNGAPVAAAAGLALMSEIQKEGAILKADRMAGLLRDEMNAVLERHEVAGYAYGTKKMSFLRRFVLQRDTLPRQARDTHVAKTRKEGDVFAQASPRSFTSTLSVTMASSGLRRRAQIYGRRTLSS
jgi:glutamate-1-semialdehyde aminotransferase